jgi:hypothetical protein
MVLLAKLLLRTNDLSLQNPSESEGPPSSTDTDIGSINQWRTDLEFLEIPLRSLLGEAEWARGTAVLRMVSWVTYDGRQAPQSQQSNVLFVSGHHPVSREWRSSGSYSDARFLAFRVDTNQGLFSVPVMIPADKSTSYAPQRIRLISDTISIRLRLVNTAASGPGTDAQPIAGEPSPAYFPHQSFVFEVHSDFSS